MTGKGTRVWKICIWNLWKTNKVEKVQIDSLEYQDSVFSFKKFVSSNLGQAPLDITLWGVGATVGFEQRNTIKKRDILQ